MPYQKISSTLIYAIYFILCCNVEVCFTIFRLNDIKINNFFFGFSKIYSFDTTPKVQKREIVRDQFIFALRLSNSTKPFKAFIRKRKSDVIFGNTQFFYTFKDQYGNKSTTKDYFLEDSKLFEGYILEYPNNSSINGYIKDNCFYGHVIINNIFYYVDEFYNIKDEIITDFPGELQQKPNAIIYPKNSVIFKDLAYPPHLRKLLVELTQKEFNMIFQRWKGKGMLCTLMVVVDYSFLTLIHRGNIEAASFHVLFSLEEANAIFRSTDFDGDGVPDNIGFYIKTMIFLTTKENTHWTFPYTEQPISVNDFITKFVRYEELQRHCLGIIFTAQKFQLKTLGASFTADNQNFVGEGGICDRLRVGRGSFNALVITAATEKSLPVPQLIFEITIAHELGHSFGSSHDSPKSTKCFGFLMSPKTFEDYEINDIRTLFSSCSKLQIMRTLVMKGSCFEPANVSFCGNGIVEDDEQCDCGLTRDCLKKDPCCVPRRTKEYPCRVNRKEGFVCHPSQGECCTSQCTYSSSLQKYVNCKNFDQTCPCTNFETKCKCGINGICIDDKCHSIECTRLNLTECPCPFENTKKFCSTCCKYKNSCRPALEVTDKVIAEIGGKTIVTQLLSQESNLNQHGQSFIFRRFCSESKSGRCVNLGFLQGKSGKYCLLNGKLGKCNQQFVCKMPSNKQNYPSLENIGSLSKFGVAEIVLHLCLLIFTIYIFGFWL